MKVLREFSPGAAENARFLLCILSTRTLLLLVVKKSMETQAFILGEACDAH